MAYTHALSTNNYGPAKIIVSSSAANGTHTTLATALADAVSGDTIFMRNSVTENVSLVAGVNITAWSGDGDTPNISITGKLTFATAGTCTISNIRLTTNSDFFLVVSGSAASIVNLEYCYLNCLNNTGISHTTANTGSALNIIKCYGNVGTTGIALFSDSSTGPLQILDTYCGNSGASVTANTKSAGQINYYNSTSGNPLTYSSSNGGSAIEQCTITTSTNATALTTSGTGAINVLYCYLSSGSGSAVSVGSGTIVYMIYGTINSSNTNALTGAGTITISTCNFTGTSNKCNVTTQTGGVTSGLTQGTAPSAGYVGEQIRGQATGVSMTTTTPKTVTSISLTPGIWDISIALSGTSSNQTAAALIGAISVNTNSFTGVVEGDSQLTVNPNSATHANMAVSIPCFRATLSATTTYYLVAQINGGATVTTSGRISGTRVG